MSLNLKSIKKAVMDIIAFIPFLISAILAIFGYLLNPQLTKKQRWVFLVLIIISLACSGVIVQQQDQRDKTARVVGTLESNPTNPLSTILFSTQDNISSELQLGTSASSIIWDGPQGEPMITMPEDQYITISKEQERLKLSTRLMGENGLIVEIIDNVWKINPQGAWDRNYNENALEVKDERGDVVLQVRLRGDRIQFQGIFYNKNGTRSRILGAEGRDFLLVPDETISNSEYREKIIPIFKYPSENHLGELDLVKEIKK